MIQTPDGLAKLAKGYKSFGAPLALIVCANHQETWRRHYDRHDSADTDAAIVTDHMMLCAADLGLDSVWVGAFNPAVIRQEFRIPNDIEPMNILMIGYAACEPQSPQRHNEFRKPLSQTVVFENF
ncbi:hypothetical protein SDC9_182218 [bioreactor metagenome]|uniref:Nitroreductase domain-containing protein n=1 Tax=bioreactor metagenome TaxID=1076179 RepID=A0A645HF55_9ZZZZ